jgi:NADH-quinone oxidoreductase subunit M
MLGVFMALDFLLFFVFWELVLVPMYFIIAIWGGPREALRGHQVLPLHADRQRADAARHPDALLPALQQTGGYTFDIDALMHANAVVHEQWWVFWASSSASPSRCRCSRSTPGCPTRTPRRPRPAA